MSKLIKTSHGIWTTGYNSKLAESYFKNELQQMIKVYLALKYIFVLLIFN